MKKTKNVLSLIAWALLFCPLTTLPANALQVSAAIDMKTPSITVTDLNLEDGISPQITLSNLSSNAGWSWLKQKSVGEYFTQLVDYKNTPLAGWKNDFHDTYVTSGGTSNTAFTNDSLATTEVTGYDDGYALWAYGSFSANFILSGNTQVEISIPVDLTVDTTGTTPTQPREGVEAYARTVLQLSSLSYEVLAYDTLWRDHWTSGHLSGDLHVFFSNTGSSDYTGAMDVNAYSVTMSYAPATTAPVPEPATMLLFATGLAGLAAGGRRKRS